MVFMVCGGGLGEGGNEVYFHKAPAGCFLRQRHSERVGFAKVAGIDLVNGGEVAHIGEKKRLPLQRG